MKRRRNLIVVRAGDTSLHPAWLRGGRRNFDLLVSYYGNTAGRYRQDGEHYHAMAGPRWPAHAHIHATMGAVLTAYDRVCFACDDLEADSDTWNRLFMACRRHRLDLAQPAIDGHVSYKLTSPVATCVLRFTNFVEVMCPVFSRPALQILAPSFGESTSGWGLSLVWWRTLGSTGRLAILDEVRVRHGRPVGEGTLYEVLQAAGVDAATELATLRERYDGADYTPMEFSRIVKKGRLRRIIVALARAAQGFRRRSFQNRGGAAGGSGSGQ